MTVYKGFLDEPLIDSISTRSCSHPHVADGLDDLVRAHAYKPCGTKMVVHPQRDINGILLDPVSYWEKPTLGPHKSPLYKLLSRSCYYLPLYL